MIETSRSLQCRSVVALRAPAALTSCGPAVGHDEDLLAAVTRPHFTKPPLIEQAITVAFQKIEEFSLGDFGLFWTLIEDQLPFCESHPLIEQTIERFDQPENRVRAIRLIEQGFLPRCFYKSADGRELVQVQNDRFTYNWIKADQNEYPRSEVLLPRFAQLFETFIRFIVDDRCYTPPDIVQCELTNVNIVPVKELGNSFADAPAAFNLPPFGEMAKIVQIESFSYANNYVLHSDDAPVGRLHTHLAPLLSVEEEEPVYKLELTARGRPDSSNLQGALKFFDMARDAINSAFMASTTRDAQRRWGYQDGLRSQD